MLLAIFVSMMYTSLLIPLIFLLGTACKEKRENITSTTPTTLVHTVGKPSHRGVSFVNPSRPVDASAFDPIAQLNANWTSIIPFGFIRNGHSKVEYNIPWQWWGERDEGVIALTQFAHNKNIKIMIKPQVWLLNGAFTGDFSLSSETEWQDLENTYYNYILHFANLADSIGAEAFCIGTEFKTFIANRPAFWGRLIDSVRVHYHGEITYAGNWDSYKTFPHWVKLDFIGIDAYFPVSDSETPTVDECILG